MFVTITQDKRTLIQARPRFLVHYLLPGLSFPTLNSSGPLPAPP